MYMKNYAITGKDNFQFFRVNDNYVKYLRKYDKNVCDNYNEGRAHIGIVLVVNNIHYVAPLTSKGKNYLIENQKYSRIAYPIDNGNLGFVRIGNMIPVPKEVIYPIIISELNEGNYKNLLLNQYLFLKKEENRIEIRKMANQLYAKRYNNDKHYLSDIMCNFKILEEKCIQWSTTCD